MVSIYPVAGPHLRPASGCQVLDEHICHQGLEHSNAKSSQLELSRELTIGLLLSVTNGPAWDLSHLPVSQGLHFRTFFLHYADFTATFCPELSA